jgi:hypothetical protein
MIVVSRVLDCSGTTAAAASGGGQAGSFGGFGGDVTTYGIVFGFLVLAAVCTLAVALWATLRPPRLAVMPQLSPDGRYWWDGSAWRPSGKS